MKTSPLIFALFLTTLCSAQPKLIVAILDAPVVVTPIRKPVHRFFDRENVVALAMTTAAISMDGISTGHFLSIGQHEMNPIARPFMASRPGAVAYFSGGLAAVVGAEYLAHRRGWHKWERAIPWVVTATEGYMAYRNYHLPSYRPTPK